MSTESDIGVFTETTWTPPDLCDYERWEAIGNTLLRMVRSSVWWLGDWWRFGEHRFGERSAQAAPTGMALKTLQNAAWVADRIEPARRREELSFDHHSAVASLDPQIQDEVLDEAEGSHLTSKEVRSEVRRRKRAERGEDPGPKPDPDVSDDDLDLLLAVAQGAQRRQEGSVAVDPDVLIRLVRELRRRRP